MIAISKVHNIVHTTYNDCTVYIAPVCMLVDLLTNDWGGGRAVGVLVHTTSTLFAYHNHADMLH